jgi:Spy/CpxP family protein refolding chaperone
MKMIFGALALALAVPAAAQTAPATDPHAGHHQQMEMDHSKHQQGMHDGMDCCEKMKQSGGKMECMDKEGEAKQAAPASEHEGHTH